MPACRPFYFVAVVLIAASIAAQGQVKPDPAEDFVESMARVERFVERRDHDRAAKAFDELLEAHAQKDYARVRRQELIELRRRIDFGLAVVLPDPKSLVSGKLSKYSRTTGQLTLEYEIDSISTLSSEKPDSDLDFVSSGGLCIHKLVFAGPYQIDYEVTDNTTNLIILTGDDQGLVIEAAVIPVSEGGQVIGHEVGAALAPIVKGKTGTSSTARAKKRSKSAGFDLRIKVTSNNIDVLIDGKRLLRHDNDGSFGRLALSTRCGRGKLQVAGKAEPAFLQDKFDAALADQRKDFEQSWQVREVLPKWLFDAIEVEAVTGLKATKESPGNLDAMSEAMVAAFFGALENGQPTRAEDVAGKLEKAGLDAAGRAWLDVHIQLAADHLSKARSRLDDLLAADPRFLKGWQLRARLILNSGGREEAREAAQAIMRDFANDAGAFEAGVPILMILGRAQDGKKVVDDALARGITSPELVKLNRMLVKALKGPDFPRRYEHKSDHYIVVSDIDSRVCRQAALILEQGFRSYEKALFALDGQKLEPFEVFLFSGQASYLDYSGGTLGQSIAGSAGLYSQFLKQLLIWNVPTRESLEETIRHEGFHQYLDRVLPNAPIWLNEGLAVYNETGKLEFGKWKTGEPRREYLRLFKTTALTPLDRFMDFGPRQFQNPKSIHLNYGQAWLMVHFFTHGPESRRHLLTDFLAELRTGRSAAQATKAVFGEIDLDKLAAEFRAYAGQMGN